MKYFVIGAAIILVIMFTDAFVDYQFGLTRQ